MARVTTQRYAIPHLKDVRIEAREWTVNSYPAGTLTFMAGLALLIPASLGLLLTGVPTILCPLPLLTTTPAFLLSTWRLQYLAIGLPVLLFFLWRPGFFHGAARVPRRSYAINGPGSLRSEADQDHPGIVTAVPSESAITFGGISSGDRQGRRSPERRLSHPSSTSPHRHVLWMLRAIQMPQVASCAMSLAIPAPTLAIFDMLIH